MVTKIKEKISRKIITRGLRKTRLGVMTVRDIVEKVSAATKAMVK